MKYPGMQNYFVDKYNIRLIHEPQYYEGNHLPDPHEDDLHGFIVQHMTQEHADFAGKSGDL